MQDKIKGTDFHSFIKINLIRQFGKPMFSISNIYVSVFFYSSLARGELVIPRQMHERPTTTTTTNPVDSYK